MLHLYWQQLNPTVLLHLHWQQLNPTVLLHLYWLSLEHKYHHSISTCQTISSEVFAVQFTSIISLLIICQHGKTPLTPQWLNYNIICLKDTWFSYQVTVICFPWLLHEAGLCFIWLVMTRMDQKQDVPKRETVQKCRHSQMFYIFYFTFFRTGERGRYSLPQCFDLFSRDITTRSPSFSTWGL